MQDFNERASLVRALVGDRRARRPGTPEAARLLALFEEDETGLLGQFQAYLENQEGGYLGWVLRHRLRVAWPQGFGAVRDVLDAYVTWQASSTTIKAWSVILDGPPEFSGVWGRVTPSAQLIIKEPRAQPRVWLDTGHFLESGQLLGGTYEEKPAWTPDALAALVVEYLSHQPPQPLGPYVRAGYTVEGDGPHTEAA